MRSISWRQFRDDPEAITEAVEIRKRDADGNQKLLGTFTPTGATIRVAPGVGYGHSVVAEARPGRPQPTIRQPSAAPSFRPVPKPSAAKASRRGRGPREGD